jgi:hypothetical protein
MTTDWREIKVRELAAAGDLWNVTHAADALGVTRRTVLTHAEADYPPGVFFKVGSRWKVRPWMLEAWRLGLWDPAEQSFDELAARIDLADR